MGFAQAFKAVANHYGWTHIVLLSDDDTSNVCWFGAKSFDQVFANNENFTYTWLRLGSEPTDEQMDDVLWEIRSRTRGITVFTRKKFCIIRIDALSKNDDTLHGVNSS